MARHSQTRQARRQAIRRQQQTQARRGQKGPFNLSFIAGAVVVVAAIAIFAVAASGVFKGGSSNNASGVTGPAATATAVANFIGKGPTVDGVGCDQGMTAGSPHIHADVVIYNKGVKVPLNPNVGHDYNDDCLFWVHEHSDAAVGVIHMESARVIHPTLTTWNKIARRSVGKNAEIQLAPKPGEQQRVYVNLKRYYGNIATLPLQAHMNITIEYGPPWVKPTTFNFKAHQL